MHWKVALNFACVKCSELETSLSTAFYTVNFAGLNEPKSKTPIVILRQTSKLSFLQLSHFQFAFDPKFWLQINPHFLLANGLSLPKSCRILALSNN